MERDSAVTDVLSRELAEGRFLGLYRDNARDLLGYALRRAADPNDAVAGRRLRSARSQRE